MTGLLPRRAFGRDKAAISVIGFGGIIVSGMEQADADRAVARAVEAGVNYFDVAPTYGDAQDRLGPALEPFRKDSFLACKTTCRDAASARAELKRSMECLRTDWLDLYQLHGLSDMKKDVDAAFAKGGAMEVLIEARKAGLVRHLGFSAHTEETALAAMDRFDFDSVMFPINFVTMLSSGFGQTVLDRAAQQGVTVIALKAMARQAWPKDAPDRKKYSRCWYQPLTDRREASLAVRFTLSQPVATALSPGEEELLWLGIEAAQNLQPLRPDEMDELRALAARLSPIFPKK